MIKILAILAFACAAFAMEGEKAPKYLYQMSEPFNLLGLLERMKKFYEPPKNISLQQDGIIDYWDGAENIDYQPVIGILTQPISKKTVFNYKDYILEVNDNFIRWAGSKTVAIPYNISDTDLNKLLP